MSRDVIYADNEFLTNEVTDEEIFETVKQINPLKAPDPHSMQDIFYQKNWDIIGKSVCKIVRSFFKSRYMLKELSKTYIILVSKIANPDSINQVKTY